MSDAARTIIIRKSERKFPIKGSAGAIYRSLSTRQYYQFRDGGYHNIYFGGTFHRNRNPVAKIRQMFHTKDKNICRACGMPLSLTKDGNISYCSECGAYVPTQN